MPPSARKFINHKWRFLLLSAAFATSFFFAVSLQAAEVIVTTRFDEFDVAPNDKCSVREAVQTHNLNIEFGGCEADLSDGGFETNDRILIPANVDPYLVDIPGTGEDDNIDGDIDILVEHDLAIIGESTADTVIDGEFDERVFHVKSLCVTCEVSFEELTIRDGNEDVSLSDDNDSVGSGGGVFGEKGSLRFTSVNILENRADRGGGGIAYYPLDDGNHMHLSDVKLIRNNSSGAVGDYGGGIHVEAEADDIEILIVDSLIKDNRADSGGGAKFDSDKAMEVKIVRTRIDNNKAQLDGGGLKFLDSVQDRNFFVKLEECTISGNRAGVLLLGEGGGIANHGVDDFHIIRCSIYDNEAVTDGGGIYNFNDLENKYFMTIRNSTLFNNRSGVRGGGIKNGFTSPGGVNVTLPGAAMDIECSTIVGNLAESSGGGIFQIGSGFLGGLLDPFFPPDKISLRNSILAFNFTSIQGPNCFDSEGRVESLGGNMTDSLSPGGGDQCLLFPDVGDVIDSDAPGIGDFDDSDPAPGRQVVRLTSKSEAIDEALDEFCVGDCAKDQLFNVRVQTCDIGAMELDDLGAEGGTDCSFIPERDYNRAAHAVSFWILVLGGGLLMIWLLANRRRQYVKGHNWNREVDR